MVLVGIAGFLDTRKVDRRFKTGYRNNEPDTRNFGRSGKRILYGTGICIVGAAVTSLSSPSGQASSAVSTADVASSPPAIVSAPATAPSDVVRLDPAATVQKTDGGVTLGSNERIVTSEMHADTTTASLQTATPVESKDAPVQVGTASLACIDDGTFFGANVCKSETLAAAYDRELKEYEAAQGRIGGKDVGVQIEQENWLEKVAKGCSDMACLTDAFDARVADLHGRYRKDS